MSIIKRNGNFPSLNSLVSDFFNDDFFQAPGFFGRKEELPAVNVKENTDNFEIEVAAPGIDKEDFEVMVDQGILTISSEKKNEQVEEKENYTRKEFSYASFRRSFTLPETVNQEAIDASHKNGVLYVKLGKKEPTIAQPKKEISIH